MEVHYRGEPTGRTWFTDGSKQEGRAGGSVVNGTFEGCFRVPGMQEVYRAEVVACTLAAVLAKPNDEIKLDNRACATCISQPRRRVVPDQDFRDVAFEEIQQKRLQVQWTPGHVLLQDTMTFEAYVDAKGNQRADECAKMGTHLRYPTETPGEMWDIVLLGSKMPSPPRSWLLKMRKQKRMQEAHWTSWLPLKGTKGPHGYPGYGDKCAGETVLHHGREGQHSATYAQGCMEPVCSAGSSNAHPGRKNFWSNGWNGGDQWQP